MFGIKGLLHKLQAAGVTGTLLSWFRSYLSNRRQKVVLPGASSNWNFIFAGVLQSILGPLLFLLHINDIVKKMGSNIRLFADDTSIFIIVDNPIVSAITNIILFLEREATYLVYRLGSKSHKTLIRSLHSRGFHKP